jgi:hypothetical protein
MEKAVAEKTAGRSNALGANGTSSSKSLSLPAVPVLQSQSILQKKGEIAHRGVQRAETIDTEQDLKDMVERILDDRFEGVRGLFLQNTEASSQQQWATAVEEMMEDRYVLDAEELGDKNVLWAIGELKNKNRGEVLLYYANLYAYVDENMPFTVDHLKGTLVEEGLYLDGDDDETLDIIFDKEGKFAKTEVEIADGCVKLSDENNVVVIMDSHQNKHQNPQLPELDPYGGGKGSQFSAEKDLAWHVTNTCDKVEIAVAAAVAAKLARPGVVYCPPKTPKGGIIYDITITYDSDTGKYVGSYHCNPVRAEQ